MKMLLVDIETSPHLSYHFGRWNQNIPYKHTKEESRMTCFAAKWYDRKTVTFKSLWGNGRKDMLDELWMMMDEADVIIGYNSKKFDVKRINSEFIREGYEQPSPFQQIDLLVQVRKHFAFSSNKLDDVLTELGLKNKQSNSGMPLWIGVQNGVKSDQRDMKMYNIQDVAVTEDLYALIRGWISPHPNMGLYADDTDSEHPICPTCGSTQMHKHKKRPTRVGLFQQWHCQDCGAYHKGRKNLKEGGTGNGVLT
jgi:hypothetical protein